MGSTENMLENKWYDSLIFVRIYTFLSRTGRCYLSTTHKSHCLPGEIRVKIKKVITIKLPNDNRVISSLDSSMITGVTLNLNNNKLIDINLNQMEKINEDTLSEKVISFVFIVCKI